MLSLPRHYQELKIFGGTGMNELTFVVNILGTLAVKVLFIAVPFVL